MKVFVFKVFVHSVRPIEEQPKLQLNKKSDYWISSRSLFFSTKCDVFSIEGTAPQGGDGDSHFSWELAHKKNESCSTEDSQSPVPVNGVFSVFVKDRLAYEFQVNYFSLTKTLKGFARKPYSFCCKPLRVWGLTLEAFLRRRRSIFPDCALLHDE